MIVKRLAIIYVNLADSSYQELFKFTYKELKTVDSIAGSHDKTRAEHSYYYLDESFSAAAFLRKCAPSQYSVSALVFIYW